MLEYQKGLDRKCMLMGMEIVGITMGVMGWIVSIVACALFTSGLMDFPQYRECTNCTQRNMNMSKVEVIIFGGIFFILAGLIQLILIFLVALDLTLNSDHENFLRSNNLMFSAEFNRWAASLLLIGGTILGWGAAALLLIGGVILCITVGVFGWMMGVIGWTVSLVPCAISILDIWMDLKKITSIYTILGALGVMGSIFGTKCCNCIKINRTRVKARFIVGIFFILAGIHQLTAVEQHLCRVTAFIGANIVTSHITLEMI
ncbi:unnamed protein product [Coregonus sp. 'balchen']|nr:unnamed protein product [Coregonus sp. 'balchen']